MIRLLILVTLISLHIAGTAQDAKQLHETAKSFMQKNDFANAILVLNRGLELEPQNIPIAKDLALSYYFQKDNGKALEIIKPVIGHADADDQCFQIAGNIYKELGQVKECEKMYKKGIKKFPESGALYNELGELLWAQKNYDAITYWEKGIALSPDYSKNYYNAAHYYYLTTDKVWSLVYGEIFVNMEPLSLKTPETKDMLLSSYKKLFSDTRMAKTIFSKNSFANQFIKTMYKQSSLTAEGINMESLMMIRTRFILDWMNSSAKKYPHRLFEYQQQLLREGMFEAYHQWLFGSSQNLVSFQNWTQMHPREYSTFTTFQRSRLFKMPVGQFYH